VIRGRYPDADVLGQRGHWDDATRRVVLDRVHNVPPFRRFDGHARETLEALCARVIPQEHRPATRRVPIAPWIDERCAGNAAQGFRFDDMPDDATAWSLGLAGLDETAQATDRAPFCILTPDRQDLVLEAIRQGDPPGDTWQRMPARRWWINVALRQISGIYYAHPFAWDEIGFGGPAYPRGYAALNFGAREPWEADEVSDPPLPGARELTAGERAS
jgi:hypothetical protein